MSCIRPIGIFDSGLGGLTVTRAIRMTSPDEPLVYLGDTARVPYGTRSPGTVIRYARVCARKLMEHDIKVLVVACNTVSAVALDMLRIEFDIPVLGVIVPGARAGVAASRSGRIGVLATQGTVASGAYARAVASESSRAEVFAQAAPLLAHLVEEGWTEGEVPRLAVTRYLESLAEHQVDTIVLGCTHYPLLRKPIEKEAQRMCGPDVEVVDSAEATAEELARFLEKRELAVSGKHGDLRFLVTDLPDRFGEIAGRFLGRSVDAREVEAVDL